MCGGGNATPGPLGDAGVHFSNAFVTTLLVGQVIAEIWKSGFSVIAYEISPFVIN